MRFMGQLDGTDLTDLDNFAAGFPHDVFAVHRAEAPVWRHPSPDGGPGFWVISSYDEVAALGRCPHALSSDGANGGVSGLGLPRVRYEGAVDLAREHGRGRERDRGAEGVDETEQVLAGGVQQAVSQCCRCGIARAGRVSFYNGGWGGVPRPDPVVTGQEEVHATGSGGDHDSTGSLVQQEARCRHRVAHAGASAWPV